MRVHATCIRLLSHVLLHEHHVPDVGDDDDDDAVPWS